MHTEVTQRVTFGGESYKISNSHSGQC